VNTTKHSSLTSLVLDPLESELEAVQILDDLGFGGLSRFVFLQVSQRGTWTSHKDGTHLPERTEPLSRLAIIVSAKHLVEERVHRLFLQLVFDVSRYALDRGDVPDAASW
jgi:hypothetical protein